MKNIRNIIIVSLMMVVAAVAGPERLNMTAGGSVTTTVAATDYVEIVGFAVSSGATVFIEVSYDGGANYQIVQQNTIGSIFIGACTLRIRQVGTTAKASLVFIRGPQSNL